MFRQKTDPAKTSDLQIVKNVVELISHSNLHTIKIDDIYLVEKLFIIKQFLLERDTCRF